MEGGEKGWKGVVEFPFSFTYTHHSLLRSLLRSPPLFAEEPNKEAWIVSLNQDKFLNKVGVVERL